MNASDNIRVALAKVRRRPFLQAAAAAVVFAGLGAPPALAADDDHWVASWATSPGAAFVYVPPVAPDATSTAPTRFAQANIQPDLRFPFPDATTAGAVNQTISRS